LSPIFRIGLSAASGSFSNTSSAAPAIWFWCRAWRAPFHTQKLRDADQSAVGTRLSSAADHVASPGERDVKRHDVRAAEQRREIDASTPRSANFAERRITGDDLISHGRTSLAIRLPSGRGR
jgi:hypothetical protein